MWNSRPAMKELLEDEWIRDVSTMIVTWVAATVTAGTLLLTLGGLV